jgi:hypothetical protein
MRAPEHSNPSVQAHEMILQIISCCSVTLKLGRPVDWSDRNAASEEKTPPSPPFFIFEFLQVIS